MQNVSGERRDKNEFYREESIRPCRSHLDCLAKSHIVGNQSYSHEKSCNHKFKVMGQGGMNDQKILEEEQNQMNCSSLMQLFIIDVTHLFHLSIGQKQRLASDSQ